MKGLWISVLSLFFLSAITAQDTQEFIDVLYLPNGSEFRGKLVEYRGDTIVFETWSGARVTLAPEHYDRLVQEYIAPRGNKREKSAFSLPDETVYFYTSLGFSPSYDPGITLTQVVGYRWDRLMSAGIGIGIENFELGYGRQVIPVFAEVRSFLSDKNISPMIAMRAGYGFALKNSDNNVVDAQGGAMLSPEFGFRFGGRTAQFTASAALHFQWARYTEDWTDWGWGGIIDSVDDIRYQRFEVKVGLLF